MSLPIYSTGDGAFLSEILNAVAMLMNHGGFTIIAAIGLLLGTVFAITSAITTAGKSVPLGGPALALVAYMVLFVPRADVIVYDTYSMAAHPVDNIPLGVALSGSLLSRMGLFVTSEFEQAYSIPGLVSTGYATPLEMLLSVRRDGLGTANSIGSGSQDNFLQTMSNYVKDCTETGILLGAVSTSQIATSDNAWSAIKFPSQAYTTKVFLSGVPADESMKTCTDAYAAIDSQWGDRLDAWNNYLTSKYNGENVRSNIDSSLNSLISGAGLSANQYMKNSLILDIVKRVSSGSYGPDSFEASMLITQAKEQARVQYAAEASMFAQFARPLMTFVEGFVYAIVPFMAFVIGFGMAGFKLLSRYILILLWVQLWMPIMSLTNLFVQMSFMREMDAFTSASNAGATNPMSLLGLAQLQGEAANWIAVAGNLVAATPALALTIVYGGAYTMVNLAGRLNPGDMVDETQLSPSMLKNDGIMSMQARATNTPLGGTTMTGAEKVAGSFSVGQMAQEAEGSAYQAQLAASQNYAHTVTQGWGTGTSGGLSRSNARAIGNDLAVSNSTSWGQSMSSASAYAEGHDLSRERRAEFAGKVANTTALAMNASGNVSLSGPGKGAGFGGSAQIGVSGRKEISYEDFEKDMVSSGFSATDGLKDVYEQAVSKESQDALRETLTTSAKDDVTQSWERIAQNTNQEQYQDSLGQLRSASSSYNRAETLSNSVGLNKQLGKVELTEAMSGNSELMGRFNSFMATHPSLQANVSDRIGQMVSQDKPIYGDESVQHNMDRYALHSGMEVLGQHLDDTDTRNMFMDMMYGSGYVAADAGVSDSYSPSANAGIGGDVAARAGAAVGGIQQHTANAAGQAAGASGFISDRRNAQTDVPGQDEFRSNEMQPVRDRGDKYFDSHVDNPGTFTQEQALDTWVAGLGRDIDHNDAATKQGAQELREVKLSATTNSTADRVNQTAVKGYVENVSAMARQGGMTPAQADFQRYVLAEQSGLGGNVPQGQYTPALKNEGERWQETAQVESYAEAKPYFERIKADYSKLYPDNSERASQAALDTMNLIKANTALGSQGVADSAGQLQPINSLLPESEQAAPARNASAQTPGDTSVGLEPEMAPTRPYDYAGGSATGVAPPSIAQSYSGFASTQPAIDPDNVVSSNAPRSGTEGDRHAKGITVRPTDLPPKN